MAATDFSIRSDRSLHRAALLARHLRTRLLLLHVVADDEPAELVARKTDRATALLNSQAIHLAELANAKPDVLVRRGTPFEAIAETAQERKVDLVVAGAHRKAMLRDIFVGTTIEGVIRTGRIPILMVNRYPSEPYGRALLAADTSDASVWAAHAGEALGFLGATEVSILHVFRAYAKGKLGYSGVAKEVITRHVAQTALEAGRELLSFLQREGLDGAHYDIILEEGDPFSAIVKTIEERQSELLVIGTHGHTGLKRILLGSVAVDVLRQVECDVLVVPLTRTAGRLLSTVAPQRCAPQRPL